MTCGGCSGAVTRVLQRAQDKGEGVESFTVSLEDQSVEVHGPIEFDDLTNRIAKTGKKVRHPYLMLSDNTVLTDELYVP